MSFESDFYASRNKRKKKKETEIAPEKDFTAEYYSSRESSKQKKTEQKQRGKAQFDEALAPIRQTFSAAKSKKEERQAEKIKGWHSAQNILGRSKESLKDVKTTYSGGVSLHLQAMGFDDKQDEVFDALEKQIKTTLPNARFVKKVAGVSPYVVVTTPEYERNIIVGIDPKTGNLYTKAEETDEEKYEDEGWFKKGLFEDGYDFGDVTRTIIGTGADAVRNLHEGVLGIAENSIDAGATGIGLVGGAFGAEDFKDSMGEFVAKDLIDEEKYANAVNPLPWLAEGLVGDLDDTSVLGEKSDELVESGGQVLGAAALQGIGVPWWLTTGVTSFGSSTEAALNDGADLNQAAANGAISAGVEILTEKLGGIKFGGKTLADRLSKKLVKNLSSNAIKGAVKLGVDATAEGFEEVISGLASAIGQKLTYANEKEFSELFSFGDAFDAFIGGAVLGGGFTAPDVINKVSKGIDPISGLTESEQKVFDKVFEEAVAEAEKGGKKLTKKEKSNLEEKVMENFKKGYVSTDKIESILGGDDYKAYKESFDNDTARQEEIDNLQKEYDELYNTKNIEKSDAQIDRQAELKKQIDALKNAKSSTEDLKKTMSDNVSKLIGAEAKQMEKSRGSYLAESYYQKEMRGVSFQADLSKYDEKVRGTVQKAIESGILNNTRRTHEMVDFIAKVSADKGVHFEFTDNEKIAKSEFAVEGAIVNGYKTTDADGKTSITLNVQSPKYLNSVVGHEITHVLEGTELYDTLAKAVKQYAYHKSKSEYKGRMEALKKLYKTEELDSELVADLVGDYLFTDKEFVRSLSVKDRNLFEKIYDEIKYLCKVVTAGSKEARELEKVKKTFADVYRESGNVKGNGETQHSLGYHAGDLGKSETLAEQGYYRNTGHFGTGTYFVGDIAKIENYNKRDGKPAPKHSVEFDNYNLYKVRGDKDGYDLHEQLKVLDGGITEEWLNAALEDKFRLFSMSDAYDIAREKYGEDWYKDEAMQYGLEEIAKRNNIEVVSKDEYAKEIDADETYEWLDVDYVEYLKDTIKEAEETANDDYSAFRDAVFSFKLRFGFKGNVEKALRDVLEYQKENDADRGHGKDSYATVFMKSLGYEGVDTRGTELDNTTYGSVIYDLKGEDLALKKQIGTAKYSLSATDTEYMSAEELQNNYRESRNVQYNLSAVETHKKSLENQYTIDSSVSLDTIMQRYDKILGIWDRLGGELDSKFLKEWNNKTERPFTIFKAQAGYKYNVELSSMCKKGVPLFEAIDTIVKKEVMKDLNLDVIGKEEKEILYDILKNHSFEIPCAICYVEQARQREGVIIDAFLNGNAEGKLGWNQVLDSIEAEMGANGATFKFPSVSRDIATDKYDPTSIDMDEATAKTFYSAIQKIANQEIKRYNKENGKNRPLLKDITPEAVKECFKGTLPANLKIFKTLLTEPSSRFRMENDLLYSSMTTRNLSSAHHNLYSLFNSQGGVSGYKTKQSATIYWGEILGKKWKPSDTRNEGGVRNQSNSDFQAYTLLDQAQMYMDFTAKGYYLQAYTKVLSELKLFGLSKGKINASLIPKVKVYYDANGNVDVQRTMENAGLDENGNPIYDDFEGINHNEAFMLIDDPEYSKNICGICIGYSDNHIAKLLDDNRVQLIIGYHDKTNDPTKRYRGAMYAKNYNGLNEAVDSEGKTKHIGFNKYVSKAEKRFDFNAETETIEGVTKFNGKEYTANDIPRLAADMYLDMCNKKGYTPAYAMFSSHPNYYKLLADFGLYDSQGNYAPHRKVEYNMPDTIPFLDENGNKKYMSSEAYIKAELQKELAVRDSIAEALADTSEEGIIPQFKAEIERRRTQNSLSAIDEHPIKRGNFNISSEEIMLEAPLRKDASHAPTETVAPSVEEAPITDDDDNVVDVVNIGQFYEIRGEEANRVAEALELQPYVRNVNGVDVPAVGFPIRYLDTYNKKANKQGFSLREAQAENIAPTVEQAPIPEDDEGRIASLLESEPYAPAVDNDEQGRIDSLLETEPPKEHPIRETAKQEEEKIIGESKISTKPKKEKEKGKFWNAGVRNLVSKDAVFEKLSLEKGNRALQDKLKMWRSRSEAKAQHFIENGKGDVKSLTSILKRAEKSGLGTEFDLYLKHKHNINRMAYDKAVFGDGVTAEMSQKIAKDFESKHPEFVEWAKDIYKINDFLLQKEVEAGFITQDVANHWKKMYPYYVPIERLIDGDAPQNDNGTGISAPLKKAKGGNQEMETLYKTMAHRILQTYKAIDKNNFGLELKGMLGTTIADSVEGNVIPNGTRVKASDRNNVGVIRAYNKATDKYTVFFENKTGNSATVQLDAKMLTPLSQLTSATDMDDITYDIDKNVVQKGENGNPTFTVYENGKRVTFEITEEMYEALKPTSEAMSKTFKPLNKASELHKKVLTELNVFFAMRNLPKDLQGLIINSKHTVRTLANIPSAVKQLATRKGQYLEEYWENGGKSNTYFDMVANEFKDKSLLRKTLGFAPDKISEFNEFIEAIPRFAEYMASRKKGETIEGAMLDASRVTTDFSDGGDITKFFNRNGVTFLNASVQGAAQQVRNIREAKAQGFKGIMKLIGKYALTGLPVFLFNAMMWDDDEEYEELSDYVKDNYYIVAKYGDGEFVRIPKGREAAVIQELFEQIGKTASGEETDWGNVFNMAVTNLAPNNPLENNVLAPAYQAFVSKKTWYGDDLVPTRLQDLPPEEQYDETIDSISKWLGENTGVSPYQINYVLNQYSGFVGDIVLPALTPEAERGDTSGLGYFTAPLKDQFTVDSTIKNQNVTDFYEKVGELKVNANSSKATDEDILMSKYMNSIQSEIGELYAEKREVQNSSLSDSRKYAKVRRLQEQINELARESLETYNDVEIDDNYAVIGNRHYRLDDGTWTKISDTQLARQQEVTESLGITPSEYWSKTDISFMPMSDGEYEYAYDHPENYAIAKAVGGYDAFRSYSKDLYNIKADKDKNGKTITNSRKKKVLEYINNLDIDYEERIILYKKEYPSDNRYNAEIVDYLNSRDDISAEEMTTILKELGFKVSADGTIRW